MSGQLHPTFYHMGAPCLQFLQYSCHCHSHKLSSEELLFIFCNFYSSSYLKSYPVLINKNSMSFIITFKPLDRTIVTVKRIYSAGHALFRRGKIHSGNLSSDKFISSIFFIFFQFPFYLRKYEVILNILLMDFSWYFIIIYINIITGIL